MKEDNKRPAAVAARQRISKNQKAWKYIRDVNNTSVSDLNRIAVVDGSRKYTYGLMFREWERYASVFSALGMTAEKHSRTGIFGSTSAEVIFAFYGLNMTGAEVSVVPAYSSFTPKRVIQTIMKEKLTDFIVTDDFAQANLIQELLLRRRELGLNNVIVLHVSVAGVTVNPMLTVVQETKYAALKGMYGPICMENLLAAYGNHPVSYATEDSADTAFILHTTGTTSGTGKPVALSDRSFNAAASIFYDKDGLDLPWDDLTTAAIVDLSNSYSMIDQIHVPFAMGAAVACVPGGILNPAFYKAISEYRITFLFTVSAMFERWLRMPDRKAPDFSSLRFVVLGGASVSAADKRRFYDFMQEHGAGDITLLNGYGISELGGACCLSSPDIDDEAIGYPLPGVNIRLLDEDSGSYLSIKDAPCEGVLYLNSDSMASPVLDGEEIIKTEMVGRKSYVCTNDLVSMDADGRLTYLGRANRYFINDDGRKYESGRVETEFSRQPGIESCGVVPVYMKATHENIPMLCVKTLETAGSPKDVILGALREVFIGSRTLEEGNIPCRVMIAEELPRNSNGKIDLYRINRGEVEGDVYTLETVSRQGSITDFRLVPYEEGPADMIKEVIDGISAEIKSNLPFNNNNINTNTQEEIKMSNAKKAFENFNALNKMGRQMMKNMFGQMTRNQENPCAGMPDMAQMTDKMQQMQGKMMDNMKQMQEKYAAGMPEVNEKVLKQAQTVLPQMQEQMHQMVTVMSQMNQTAVDMMQKMFDQNCKMMDQFFEAAEKQVADTAKKAEKPAKKAEPAKKAAAKKAEPAKKEADKKEEK